MTLKTPLGRVLGLGAAGGVQHWWLQRVGAVALAPLGAWFAIALFSLPDLGYTTVHAWLAEPIHAVLMLLLAPIAVHHAWIGVTIVLEDYVHGRVAKSVTLLLAQLLHLLIGVAAMFAILKVALGGAA
ncbi:MAG TPA: succinate dehydrogenase, hydrophobic membrane anchor protein [Steroidobacteraceae bacterium]|nr:succinate dehydrogenase, hydrophobic membrane anchor protein [Steroidobacteraceae bacterium]